ncbi:hypothetical protein HDU98_003525, partial [Podochytrium sp. JEL0797]
MSNPITSAASQFTANIAQFANDPALLSDAHDQRRRYKDLLIFEERLRWNAKHQLAHRRVWLAILAFLVCIVLVSGYSLREGSTTPSTLYIFCLSSVSLVAFFALRLYRSRLRDPTRFRPMLNSVLKHYSLEMNARSLDLGFTRKVPVQFAEGYKQYRDK